MAQLHTHLAQWLAQYAKDFNNQKMANDLSNTRMDLFEFISTIRDGDFLCRVVQTMDNTINVYEKCIYKWNESCKDKVGCYNIR